MVAHVVRAMLPGFARFLLQWVRACSCICIAVPVAFLWCGPDLATTRFSLLRAPGVDTSLGVAALVVLVIYGFVFARWLFLVLMREAASTGVF